MTVHSDLIADAVWPADIRAALGLSASPNQVYAGRRPRKIATPRQEVMIERGPVEEGSTGGLNKIRRHAYVLRVREKRQQDGNQTGVTAQTAVDAALRTLAERYHGQAPAFFVAAVPTLFTISAEEITPDSDPTDHDVAEGTLAVTFHVSE